MRTILRVFLMMIMLTAAACGGDAPAEQPTVDPAAAATSGDSGQQAVDNPTQTVPSSEQQNSSGDPNTTQQAGNATVDSTAPTREGLPPIPTSTVAATTTPDPNIPEAEVTVDVTAALAATAVITEDPFAGQSFDSLLYYQTGGASNETLTIELFSDGRLVRNGTESRVDGATVNMINAALNDANFYTLNSVYSAPSVTANSFSYTLLVRRGELEYQISANDAGLTNAQTLKDLFITIRNLGGSTP